MGRADDLTCREDSYSQPSCSTPEDLQAGNPDNTQYAI